VNLLRGSKAYLAGPVDQSNDPVSWRTKVRTELLEPMGILTYDPLIKPSWMPYEGKLPVSKYKDYLNKAQEGPIPESNMPWSGMAECRRMCLRMVSSADFVICYLPKQFTIGTFEELTLANQQGKPILVVTPEPLNTTWLPVMLSGSCEDWLTSHQFNTWEALYEFIARIDNDEWVSVDIYKWLFASYFSDSDVRKAHEIPNHK
jgi:hypothetical protein